MNDCVYYNKNNPACIENKICPCNPDIVTLCDACEGKGNDSCWKCGGRGLTLINPIDAEFYVTMVCYGDKEGGTCWTNGITIEDVKKNFSMEHYKEFMEQYK